MNVINLHSSTGKLCSIIKPWPLHTCTKYGDIPKYFSQVFQITTLITLFVMTDQSFLFSDSNFEASCQGQPMDLFLKISVLQAHFCWLGDVEEIIVLGRKVVLGKKIIQEVRGDLKSRIAATGHLYGLITYHSRSELCPMKLSSKSGCRL